MTNYKFDYSHNPAIIYNRDEIHLKSNLIPDPGDIFIFQGLKAIITRVWYSQNSIRPVRMEITADKEVINKIRELLTFRLDNND